MTARPHLLHLSIDEAGYPDWTLECPYGHDERPPGRNCNIFTDEADPSTYESGCFARQYLDEMGFTDTVAVDVRDPSFPLEVGIEVENFGEDAYPTIVNWESVS